MGRFYFYLFRLLDWVPLHEQREEIQAAMMPVLGVDSTIEWDMFACTVGVEIDLGGRRSLEGLAVAVQALNSGFVYVEGWPSQSQTCALRDTGGVVSVPVAIGRVDCESFGPTG